MTVRTVLNVTTRVNKRSVTCSRNEHFPPADTTVAGENHTHLVSFNDGAGVAWFYPGYEHIPAGSSQAGTQPV